MLQSNWIEDSFSYLIFRLIGGAALLSFFTCGSRWSDGSCVASAGGAVADDGVVAVDAFVSPVDDELSRSAEFLRIIIVLVFGSIRLCSRRIFSGNGLGQMRGGTGGGEMSRGGSSGASGACWDWAAERWSRSFTCLSRRRGGSGGGGARKLLSGCGTFTCGDIGNGPKSCTSTTFESFGLVGYIPVKFAWISSNTELFRTHGWILWFDVFWLVERLKFKWSESR